MKATLQTTVTVTGLEIALVIAGDVIVGRGSGPGAILAPGQHKGRQNTLTLQNTLTFNADGSYQCGINNKSAKADKVVANGVSVNGGRLLLHDRLGFALSLGTIITVIENSSADSINGTFSNIPDGGTVTVGSNTFQVSYSGGDGNDLALTVVE